METWLIGVIAGGAILLLIILSVIIAVRGSSKKRKEFFEDMRKRQLQIVMPMNPELHGMNLEYLVGKKGIATTDIKPIGKMRIDNEVFEVRTIGTLIKTGSRIVVVKVNANQDIYVDFANKQDKV